MIDESKLPKITDRENEELLAVAEGVAPVLAILVEEGFLVFPRKFESVDELNLVVQNTAQRLAPYLKYWATMNQ